MVPLTLAEHDSDIKIKACTKNTGRKLHNRSQCSDKQMLYVCIFRGTCGADYSGLIFRLSEKMAMTSSIILPVRSRVQRAICVHRVYTRNVA